MIICNIIFIDKYTRVENEGKRRGRWGRTTRVAIESRREME